MAFVEWSVRVRAGLAAGAGVVAILAAAPSAVWADQANDNSTTTVVAGGDFLGGGVVAPLTTAVQANLACAANVNVLGSQRDSGNCAPGAQSNANRSTTRAGAGDLVVAPVTAALQANVSCPVNVNVLANQRNSGNCAPGPQSNANTADTRVRGGAPGPLGGPVVAPITNGLGLNVTCPANVNVLSSVRDSGGCVGTDTSPGTAPPPPTTATSQPSGGDTPPAAQPPAGDSQPLASTSSVVSTSFADAPGPPNTGALAIARPPVASFPVLGLLVLVVLVAAAVAARRLHREQP